MENDTMISKINEMSDNPFLAGYIIGVKFCRNKKMELEDISLILLIIVSFSIYHVYKYKKEPTQME